MKFSVIVPVYNCEGSLPRCIESILYQTYPDWELILVDDGSTDGSFALCGAYARQDGRIRVIHQENAGQGPARNNGMKAATGDYIVFCDADDFYENDALEVFANAAKDKMPDLIVGGYRKIQLTDNGSVIILNENKAFNFHTDSRDNAYDMYMTMKRMGLLNAPWAKAYKRDKIIANLISFPHYIRCEDVFFNIDFFEKVNTVIVTEAVLYNYDLHDRGFQTKKFPPDMFEIHKAVSLKVLNSVSEWGKLNQKEEQYLNQCYVNGLMALLRANYLNQWNLNKKERRALSKKMLCDALTIRSCRTVPDGITNKIIRMIVKSRSVAIVNSFSYATIIIQKIRG